MKLLLDKCAVHDLKTELPGPEIAMVVEAGAFLEPSLEVRMVADQLSARSY